MLFIDINRETVDTELPIISLQPTLIGARNNSALTEQPHGHYTAIMFTLISEGKIHSLHPTAALTLTYSAGLDVLRSGHQYRYIS
jgi:hypothetical protein